MGIPSRRASASVAAEVGTPPDSTSSMARSAAVCLWRACAAAAEDSGTARPRHTRAGRIGPEHKRDWDTPQPFQQGMIQVPLPVLE